MKDLQIAFDLKAQSEYFIKYKKKEYTDKLLRSYRKETKNKTKKFYIFEKQQTTPENIGTFLLAFLNTDFNDITSCKDFIIEYLYVNLLVRINKDIYTESEIHGENTLVTDINNTNFDIILSEEEIEYYFDKIYAKFKNDFLEYQKMYRALSNFKYFELLQQDMPNKTKEDKLKLKAIKEASKTETYYTSLSNIASTTLNLNVNFNLLPFYTDKNKEYIIENIPYYFSSKMYYDILFISFREFASSKEKIQVQACQNCGKYFIPLTAHDTLYCNSLFDGKRTCKQIGAEKAHLENLEKDKLLKLYRSRYQTLSKQASTSAANSKSAKMYARYKKDGPIVKQNYITGIITAEEFEKWIDSTKLR